jgi:predicted HicB family RNase H-like nuclease
MDPVTAIRYDIPEDLHRALKVRAAEKGVSLKDLIIQLLNEALESDKAVA